MEIIFVSVNETRFYDDRGTKNCYRILALYFKHCYRIHFLCGQPSLIYDVWWRLIPREMKLSGLEAYLYPTSRLRMSAAKGLLPPYAFMAFSRIIHIVLVLTATSGHQGGNSTVTPLTLYRRN
jgi:hypothetical protein